MNRLRITGGRVLLPNDGEQLVDVSLEDGCIASFGGNRHGAEIDARGLLVLPGIVDLHGDAFERQLQPRPGVGFSAEIALQDTETQLLANGITTAFHGVTLSWEPGLRGLTAWRALLDALEARRWTCDMRVHLRWEAYNLEALDTALADIGAGRVHLLAFNDHTPPILKKINDPVVAAKYSERAGVKLDDFRALAQEVGAREHAVPAALDRIGAAAREAGLPMASHDDATIATRRAFRARGARICEFPMAEEVGQEAREAGDWVVMGCPNVVRGGSHLGWTSAARMVEAGICRVLTSDYFYPAMLRAPMALAANGAFDLTVAWNLISGNPARAAGLADRGAVEEGLRADLVLVDPARPQVIATIVGGHIGYLTAEGAARLSLASSR
jgi:alpha-D-ribose 1-methylphosphonate 5-triphosphate diphosphatase